MLPALSLLVRISPLISADEGCGPARLAEVSKQPKLRADSWNNRKGGTAEGGTRREPLPNATQARMDTRPIRIKTSLDTYQNALFL